MSKLKSIFESFRDSQSFMDKHFLAIDHTVRLTGSICLGILCGLLMWWIISRVEIG
jgi:hypothetical protein